MTKQGQHKHPTTKAHINRTCSCYVLKPTPHRRTQAHAERTCACYPYPILEELESLL